MLIEHLTLVVLLVGTQVLFTWLAVVNLRYSTSRVTAEADWLAERFDIDDPQRLLDYQRLNAALAQLQSWLGLVVLLLVLYAGVFTLVVDRLAGMAFGIVLEGVALFVLVTISLTLFSLPFESVGTFAIEEIFEFNQQTVTLWVRDALVGLAISLALVAVVAAAIMGFVVWIGWWWWVAAWAFVVLFSLAMNVLYPRIIAPLFNEFEPVESGPLRTAVEEVFDRTGFECSQIYTMDASRRSSKVNAYFVGFGRTKRVVLFDTLVDRLEVAAIQSVLAHELAHWKRKHVWKGVAAEAVRLGIVFAILGYLVGSTWVYDMFGLDPAYTHAGIVIGIVWVGPLVRLSSPLSNRVWLRFEREADRFATEVMDHPEGLVSALTQLTRENLANPFPHPWYEAFYYDHPPVPERIRAIERYAGTVDEPT